MQLFNNYPPNLREQAQARYRGRIAIIFPAVYFHKVWTSPSPLWENISQMDSDGIVAKTAPTHLINDLIKYLVRHGHAYKLEVIK